LKPQVFVPTEEALDYAKQSDGWKHDYQLLAVKGYRGSDRLWGRVIRYFAGDQDVLDHLINAACENSKKFEAQKK
jgi:hypothetical protein